MKKIPPIAAVSAKGPLGVAQLPRLWSKVLLHAKGLLPEGYSYCGNGFDRYLLETLGLDRERVLAFLQDELPTYARFEAWVRQELGGEVAQAKIDKVNEVVLGHAFPEERRKAMLESSGFAVDTPTTTTAELNQLDDWQEFHRYLTED